MKLKLNFTKLLTGAILSVMTLSPIAVKAQSSSQVSDFPILEGVEVTPQQQEEFDEIRQETRFQVEEILSPEQRDQFRSSLAEGQDVRSAVSSMNLSPDQRTQLRTVLQSSMTQVRETITPEQRDQIRQNIMMRLQNSPRGSRFLRR